jgi:hypothetical protein
MITDRQIDKALEVMYEEISLPYMAHVADFINSPTDPPPGPLRDAALKALREADNEANDMNRAFVRRVLEAAL